MKFTFLALLFLAFASQTNAFALDGFNVTGQVSSPMSAPAYVVSELNVYASESSQFQSGGNTTVSLACGYSTFSCDSVNIITPTHLTCNIPSNIYPSDCNITVQIRSEKVKTAAPLIIGNRIVFFDANRVVAIPTLASTLMRVGLLRDVDFIRLNVTSSDTKFVTIAPESKSLVFSTGSGPLYVNISAPGVYPNFIYALFNIDMVGTDLSQFPASEFSKSFKFVISKTAYPSPSDTYYVIQPNTTLYVWIYVEFQPLAPVVSLKCALTDGGATVNSVASAGKQFLIGMNGPFFIKPRNVDEGHTLYCRWQFRVGSSEFIPPPPFQVYTMSRSTDIIITSSCSGIASSVFNSSYTLLDGKFDLAVPYSVSSCSFGAVVTSKNTTLTFQGPIQNASSPLVSGSQTGLQYLSVGSNVMLFSMISESGILRSVSINVSRNAE